jgi:hypothetical protein
VEEQVLRLGDGGAVLLAYQERTQVFAVGVEKLDLLCPQAPKADVNKQRRRRRRRYTPPYLRIWEDVLDRFAER